MARDEFREQIVEYEHEKDHLFFLGDHMWARIIKTRRYPDRDGNWRIQIVMIPDPLLIERYNLDRQKDIDVDGFITKDYDAFLFIPADPGSQRISYGFFDFYGREPPQFAFYKRNLVMMLKEQIKKNKLLSIMNIKTNRDIETFTTQPMKMMKRTSDLKREALRWAELSKKIGEDEDEEKR